MSVRRVTLVRCAGTAALKAFVTSTRWSRGWASWDAAGHPEQVRLQAYLDDTEALLAHSRVEGTVSFNLATGLPTGRGAESERKQQDFGSPN